MVVLRYIFYFTLFILFFLSFFYLFVCCLFVYLFIYLFTYLFIYLFIYLFNYLFIYYFIYLFVYYFRKTGFKRLEIPIWSHAMICSIFYSGKVINFIGRRIFLYIPCFTSKYFSVFVDKLQSELKFVLYLLYNLYNPLYFLCLVRFWKWVMKTSVYSTSFHASIDF